MMSPEDILKYLGMLDGELGRIGTKGEICLYGGAVMCLLYQARPSTRDIDAVFRPTREIREVARRIAIQEGLDENWLNDGVKGFLTDHAQRVYLDLPSLKVYVPEPDYLLAMKTLAARVDATDRQDVITLIKELHINSAEEVFAVLEKYYPNEQIRPATRFFLEEIFQS
jgi:hypothetical protein